METPGVYSSFTMLRGPAWSVNPDRSEMLRLVSIFTATFDLCLSQLTDSWRHNTLIVIRIYTDRIAFQIERKLAIFDVLQLILVQIRPTPDSRVDDMRKTFSARDLKSAIECSLYCYAFARMSAVCGDRCDERVELVSFLLQLLHQRFDGSLCESFWFASLLDVCEKRKDNNKISQWEKRFAHKQNEIFCLELTRWHIKLCTMLRQASADVGAVDGIVFISVDIAGGKRDREKWMQWVNLMEFLPSCCYTQYRKGEREKKWRREKKI